MISYEEGHIEQYYCPPKNTDKAEVWKVDYDYLGLECNPNYYIQNIADQDREVEQKTAIIVNTYEELLYGLADPSFIITEIRPQTPDDLMQIEEFLAIDDKNPIVLDLNNNGTIYAHTSLTTLNLENAIVPAVSDIGCLFDNKKGQNNLESQPNPIQHFIKNDSYTLLSTNYIQANLYNIDETLIRFINKKLDVFIPVNEENVDSVVQKSPTFSSDETDNHGLLIVSQIAAHLNPTDENNNAINLKFMCLNVGVPTGSMYNSIMNSGAQFMGVNRSIGINPKFSLNTLSIINSEYQPYISADRIAPVIINGLGNEGEANDLTFTHPFSGFILGAAAFDENPFESNDPNQAFKLSRYSNFPDINDYAPYANGVAYGTFEKVEGGNQNYYSQSGTSMAGPHLLIASINGINLLSEEERNSLKGLKSYEVFNTALKKYGSKSFTYSNIYGDVNAKIIVPGQIAFNSMPDKKFYNGWTIAPTATISINDYLSNYNAGNFGMIDWTSTTPITYPNQIITRSIAEITTQDYATISASLVITSPFGQILNAKFNLKPEKQPIDFELAFINLPISLTNMAIKNQPLITIPRNQIQYIPFSNAKHRNYLPLIKKP